MSTSGQKIRDFLVARYFTADARTLGLFRIIFGTHLICNVYDRTQGPDAIAFYTNDGVMPNHYALFAPAGDKIWSLLFPFSTPAEVQVAFIFILAVYFLYVIGYKTKLAQILAIVCLLSLDNRNLHLQNGGIVVTNIVAIWTAFLPLGARFSVDSLLRSLREKKETDPSELEDRAAMVRSPKSFARLAYFGIVFNFAVIYFFNCVHKHGVTWRDGSAVHWVLWQNRINTIWAAWLRMHEPSWFSPVSTWATLVIEGLLPMWLLVPIHSKWTRRAAILSIFGLHSMISLLMTLGPFSYSMMSFSLLLLSEHDWADAKRLLPTRRRFVVFYDASSARHHLLARVLARLDLRHALEFADSRTAPSFAELPAALRAEIAGRPFVLWEKPAARAAAQATPPEVASRAADGAPQAAMASSPAAEASSASAPEPGASTEARESAAAVSDDAAAPSRAAASAGTASTAPSATWTGFDGAARAVAALPLGVLYAWLLRVPPLSSWVDGVVRNTTPSEDAIDDVAEPYAPSPAALFKAHAVRIAGEVLAAAFFAIVLVQIGVDNWAIPDRYRIKNRPEFQREIVEYLRVPQGWSMFSPDAPRDDGTVVIDAVLSDGTHIDPRKQRPPDFEAAFNGPWFDDQQWCDWDLRMRFDGNRRLHPYFRDYIFRLDKFRSWKQKAKIVSFEAYWVNNAAPPPGSTRPYNITKQLLFTSGNRP
jgi:hypothetical protein